MLKSVFKSRKVIVSAILILLILTSIITGVLVSSRGRQTKIKQKLELGEKYLSEMKYEEAILVFKEVIEIEPRNVQAYLGVSEAYVALEQPEEAIKWLETGIGEIEAHGEVIEGCEELYIKVSEIHQSMDNDDLAEDVLQRGYIFTLLEIFIRLLEELTGFDAEQITQEIDANRNDNDVIVDNSSPVVEEIVTNSVVELKQDKKIEWIDNNLEVAIRELIQKESGDVYLSDIWYLDLIELDNKNIGTLEDFGFFEGLPNLRSLYLSSNEISDISALKDLTHLFDLGLDGNKISDISALKDLVNLINLSLGDNEISDISALENLTNLTNLTLPYNEISDISALKDLTNLISLPLHNNEISDISALGNLRKLEELNLSWNKISDISVLKDLTNLIDLGLNVNKISDISALKDLVNLINLGLGGNEISDISALKDLTNLTFLWLDGNEISEISVLKDLTNLTELSLGDNEIRDISALKNLTNLTYLTLDKNEISDITVLKDLTNLIYLNLSNTKISDISVLNNLTNLEALTLTGHGGLINDWSSVEHIEDVSGRPE